MKVINETKRSVLKLDAIYAKTRSAFSDARNHQLQVDWFRIITELRGRGYTLETIGIAIGVPKTTVYGWTDIATPNYPDGMALMELWREEMSKVPLALSGRKRTGNRTR